MSRPYKCIYRDRYIIRPYKFDLAAPKNILLSTSQIFLCSSDCQNIVLNLSSFI